MGHALLTKLLLPTLLATAEEEGSDVRVVNLSSEGHQMAPGPGIIYDQAELETWGTWRRYGQAKLANILHARELQKRYPSITATSLHPGVIVTELYSTANQSNAILRIGISIMRHFLMDVHGGAKNQLWAATADKKEVRSTWYWKPVGISSGGSFWHAKKPKLAETLWTWTENELDRHGY
jgi:NAD(P)-dependent dehydrogenase (short-subunit alcohol dehydrogenase family)